MAAEAPALRATASTVTGMAARERNASTAISAAAAKQMALIALATHRRVAITGRGSAVPGRMAAVLNVAAARNTTTEPAPAPMASAACRAVRAGRAAARGDHRPPRQLGDAGHQLRSGADAGVPPSDVVEDVPDAAHGQK